MIQKIGTVVVAIILGIVGTLFVLNLWLDGDPANRKSAKPAASPTAVAPSETTSPTPSASPSPTPTPSPKPKRAKQPGASTTGSQSAPQGPRVVSAAYIESSIKRQLDAKSSIRTKVDCPSTVKLVRGATISCAVHNAANGARLQTARVTMLGSDGKFRWTTG